MKKALLLTALSLCLAVGTQAQSKLTGTALQQLTRVKPGTVRQMAPNRNGRLQILPQERITEGYTHLVLHLESEADVQAVCDQVKALGGDVLSVIGPYVDVQMPCAAVSEIENNSAVSIIDGIHQAKPMCNLTRRDMGVDQLHNALVLPELELPQDYDGTGVIVGVIDIGFDYQHFNFRDKEGRSRIRAVWQEEHDKNDPSRIVYKTYETPEEIARLTTDPITSTAPIHSHASHTTGISAGSAYLPEGATVINDSIGKMKGMAPNADLILCSVSCSASDAAITAAARYIFHYADSVGMPASVNISMGDNLGPHDGTDYAPFVFSWLTEDMPGRSICISAGNEGGTRMSFRKVFENDGDSIMLVMDTSGKFDFWCDDESPITYNLHYNDRQDIYDTFFESPLQTTDTLSTLKGSYYEYDFTLTSKVEKYNDRTKLQIKIECDTAFQHTLDEMVPAPRYLSVTIYGQKGQALTGYAESKFIDLPKLCPDAYIQPTADYSINNMCCTPYVISVGAHVTRTSADAFHPHEDGLSWFVIDRGEHLNDIASFSSYGTDIYGDTYPTISAPGSLICSSMCNYEPTMETYPYGYTSYAGTDNEGYLWGWMQGTSMSCPAVTGVAALMLQANPKLTTEQIKDYLTKTATHDSYTEDKPHRFGAGKVNALRAVQAVVADLTPTQIEQVAAPRLSAGRRYNLQGQLVGPEYRGLFIER